MKTFNDMWLPGFVVAGYGFAVIIPKHDKSQELTITGAKIYALAGGWANVSVASINNRPNQWNVLLVTTGLTLPAGSVQLASITGSIS